MALALRTIRRSRWDKEAVLGPLWLPHGDIVADPLADLGTDGGRLSVWHVEDDRSNLERVLVALAANRSHLTNVDYIIFDQALLTRMGIGIRQSTGATPDGAANATWHRDLCELSGHRLVGLARAALESGETARLHRQRLRRLMRQALDAGQLDAAKLKPGVLGRICEANS